MSLVGDDTFYERPNPIRVFLHLLKEKGEVHRALRTQPVPSRPSK